ncbi:MAG: MarR family transcriptional regulator [Anaerolineales bacterium]|nr:MarR family transcriptional regulator [Anaerolineales bacterium]
MMILQPYVQESISLHPQEFSYIIKILDNQDNVKGVFMTESTKADLKKRVLMAVRDYGINLTQFRNAMSEWAGLNVTDMECFRFLSLKGIATPSELARYTGLTSGATTTMIDRLEKAGLVERQPNPNDRRGTLIVTTKSSTEKAASWFASARQAQDELISSYSEEELEIIADVFEQFVNLWKQEREKIRKE